MTEHTITRTWQSVVNEHLESAAVRARPAEDRNVPDINLPLSEVKVYETLSITEVSLGDQSEVELDQPIDLLAFDAEHQPTNGPCVGVILRHEQAWRMKGLSMGRLLHSLCLAPGEVTQVAMVDWQRRTSGSTSEGISEIEEAIQAAQRDRTTHEVTSSVASELQAGGSSVFGFSTQVDGGIDGVLGFLGGSTAASSNTAIATNANWSTGVRNASAESRQEIREHTAQHASNARSRRATLVQEVSETQTEQFRTRVVANYNHMHALNMQYYEVLQVFELATQPVRAERCIFLPMQVMTFDSESVESFATELAMAARALGNPVFADAILKFTVTQQESERAVANLKRKITDAENVVAELNRGGEVLRARMDSLNSAEIPAAQQALAQAQDEVNAAGQSPLLPVAQAKFAMANEGLRAVYAAVAETVIRLRETEARLEEAKKKRDTAIQAHQASLTAQALATVDVLAELNSRKLVFNQAIWAQFSPASIEALLVGKSHQGTNLVETVDPRPIAIIGNYLGFRWSFPDTEEGAAAAAAFTKRYVDDHAEPALDTHVLPTGGVFAEGVLGRANAAEKLDLTRFWHWDKDTIPILPTAIRKLTAGRHAARPDATPGKLGPAAASLQVLPTAPAGPAHGLTSVISASLFRDMSGSGVIGELLKAGQKAAADGSKDAQQVAHENISAFLDHIEQLLPELTKAVSDGKLDPSTLGALQNALGGKAGTAKEGAAVEGAAKDGAAINPEALLSEAAEAGLLL